MTEKVEVHLPDARGAVIGDNNTVTQNFAAAPAVRGRRRRVLVGATPELAEYPVSRTFVDAARDAVTRAGFQFARMADRTGAGLPTAVQYREQVRQFDLYVSLLGFRYGPLVRDDRTRSYQRLEFEVAAASDRPHVVILIKGGEYAAPRSFFVDRDPGRRQRRFRAEIKSEGHHWYEVEEPGQLEELLFHLLRDPPRRHAPVPPPLPVRAAGAAVVLGVGGFLTLWGALHQPVGWAAGVAVLATAGTWWGALRPRRAPG